VQRDDGVGDVLGLVGGGAGAIVAQGIGPGGARPVMGLSMRWDGGREGRGGVDDGGASSGG
jgi:hypothetical protein